MHKLEKIHAEKNIFKPLLIGWRMALKWYLVYVDLLYAFPLLWAVKKDILKVFGEHIRELRIAKKWSQEELAEKADFHRTYIGMIERGERNPSLKNLKKFADAFGLSLSELMKF